jgi:integrase
MAHLVRPWTYRYLDADGRRVPKATPGAHKVKERARKWYGAGIPGWPKSKRVPLATDKNVAKVMLADLVRKAERGEAELEDGATAAREVALVQHLTDFESSLRNRLKPVGEEHIRLVMSRIRKTFASCSFKYPGEIQEQPVLAFLAERRRLPPEEGGLSAQTVNFYLGAVNQFCRWMCSKKAGRRMRENPLAEAEKGDVKLDRRHDRRDLKVEELERLFRAARDSLRPFAGLYGLDRYMIYHTACGTGFRTKELSRLTPESFDLNAAPPVVHLPARRAKNKKAAAQPLPTGLAAELRDYLRGRAAGKPLWPGYWKDRSADMLKIDLTAAGIPYEVQGPDGPQYADFHALRHTYLTLLERAGASPKTAQTLGRHSDPRLTMNRYTHADLAALGIAVDRLPLPGNADTPRAPTYEQLAVAVLALRTALAAVLGCPLVAPRVAPDTEISGDGRGLRDTNGAAAAGPEPRTSIAANPELKQVLDYRGRTGTS